MTVRNLVLGCVGFAAALWMATAPWLFGLRGDLIIWYLPAIALPFAALQFFVLRRITVAERRGRPVGRAVYVALALSWLCAFGFGMTVPESMGGTLETVMSHLFGQGWLEMSIALCNPLGIIAFATVIAALIFALAAGRDPRPSEDDLLDEAERKMAPHPLEG